jgi:peptide/nickel transport system substrate-binding protein
MNYAIKHTLCALAALAAVACAGEAAAQAQPQPKRGGAIVYATGTDAVTLDPQFVTDVPVQFDEKGAMKPLLAESWEVSPDRLTWTFKLRKGVKFHDGTPFDAEAVKFTIERILDEATGSPRKSTATVIKAVTVTDPHTIALSTEKPFAPLLAQLSAYNLAIISPTQARKEGKNYAKAPSGTGPFRLESWRTGERMTLQRNDDYWGEKPFIDKLEVRVTPEDQARALQLLGGEVDVIASVPPVLLPRLASAQTKVLRETGFRTVYIGLNSKMAPWDNPKVRQALAHAINTDAIIKGVLSGVGRQGVGIESPVIGGAHQGLTPLSFDPAKAKALLAEAGFPGGVDSVLYTPTGRYLNDRQVAEAVQAQAREVGIRLKIEAPEWATFQQLLDTKDKVPLFLLGKGSPTGDLDMTINLLMQSKGRMNYFGFEDAEVDRLIAAQRTITEPAEREQALARVQEAFHAAHVAIVLFYEEQVFAARTNIHGITINPNEFVSFARAWKQ